MSKATYRLSPVGEGHVRNPTRNRDGRIRTTFFQQSILIFVFLNGSYEPSEFKRFFESFRVLALPDEEEMRTRQYYKWKHYVDAAKQQLLKKRMLVATGNGRFEIPTERIGEMFKRVSNFLEVVAD